MSLGQQGTRSKKFESFTYQLVLHLFGPPVVVSFHIYMLRAVMEHICILCFE